MIDKNTFDVFCHTNSALEVSLLQWIRAETNISLLKRKSSCVNARGTLPARPLPSMPEVGVPLSAGWGIPPSGPGTGTTPRPDLGLGTPHPDLGWGTPPSRPGMRYPPVQTWDGVPPPVQSVMGYLPPAPLPHRSVN